MLQPNHISSKQTRLISIENPLWVTKLRKQNEGQNLGSFLIKGKMHLGNLSTFSLSQNSMLNSLGANWPF